MNGGTTFGPLRHRRWLKTVSLYKTGKINEIVIISFIKKCYCKYKNFIHRKVPEEKFHDQGLISFNITIPCLLFHTKNLYKTFISSSK